LLYVGVCSKSLASQMLLTGYKDVEITGHEIGTAGRSQRSALTSQKSGWHYEAGRYSSK